MRVTIPSKITNGKELVIISKEEYEALEEPKRIYEPQPTATQKRVLLKARKNRKSGKALSLGEFKQKLGLTD